MLVEGMGAAAIFVNDRIDEVVESDSFFSQPRHNSEAIQVRCEKML